MDQTPSHQSPNAILLQSASLSDSFLIELTTCQKTESHHCDCVGDMLYHDNQILCTQHDKCEAGVPIRVCLSCMKRMCAVCFNDVHQHPLLSGCHTISYTSYINTRDMFISLGHDKHQTPPAEEKVLQASHAPPKQRQFVSQPNIRHDSVSGHVLTLAAEDDDDHLKPLSHTHSPYSTINSNINSPLNPYQQPTHPDPIQSYSTAHLPQHNQQRFLTLDDILHNYKRFYKKHKSQKHVSRIVNELRLQYSGQYPISFFEFLREYTKSNTLFYNPVNISPYQRFHELNWCTRFLYHMSLSTQHQHHHTMLSWKLPVCRSILASIRSEQGENVYHIFYMMYNLMIVNIIGVVFFILMLLLPWLFVDSLKNFTFYTSVPDWTNYKGLLTGIGINQIPVSYGAFPHLEMMSDYISTDPSSQYGRYFAILFPFYVFAIFLLGTVYLAVLVVQNRQFLSQTLSSPALLGSVSTTLFTMFQHNLTIDKASARRAQQELDINIRMALIKKYNPDQRLNTFEKFTNRKLFPYFLSNLLIIVTSVSMFFLHYYIISEYRYIGESWMSYVPVHLRVLIFPFIFFFIKWILEYLCVLFVGTEVPRQIHLYNRFRSVLYYRLSFLNVCFLLVLIVISIYNRGEAGNPDALSAYQMYNSITYSTQQSLGYCDTSGTTPICPCAEQIQAFFWYRFLIMGLFFEFLMFGLSVFKAMFQKCCCSKHKSYFSPIPRLSQIIFLQCLIWCSILFLPGGVIIGFVTNVIAIFFSFIKAQVLKDHPSTGVYLLPSKIQFYTSFALLLIISYVPNAVFMSQTVTQCGPFVKSKSIHLAPLAMFIDRTNQFPMIISEIFAYTTSPLVLWILIITNVAIITSFSSLSHISKKTRDKLIVTLKIESTERTQMLKQIGVDYTGDDARGEKLFMGWILKMLKTPLYLINNGSIEDLPVDGKVLYTHLLRVQRRNGNFIVLCKYTDDQLVHIFQSAGCAENIANALLVSFKNYRNELLLHNQHLL